MLYRGSEVMREVSWVIFDEIHYMRDKGKCIDNKTLITITYILTTFYISARCCMGGNAYSITTSSTLCVLISHYSERNGICRVGL